MIRAIVVDDEKPSREVLCNYLNEFCPSVDVLASASSIKTAYKTIVKYQPDIVFLDIELPDGSGFDLLKKFERLDFRIIFVTAYSEYAVKAFRVNALDYLLKPVKVDELRAAVNKVRKEIESHNSGQDLQTLIKALASASGLQQTISIPSRKGYDVLKLNDIIMCEADAYCTHFYLNGNRKITSSKHMKHYEELLKNSGFLRVHHSWLVNLAHIDSYSNQEEIMLSGRLNCPLGQAYKKEFIDKLKSLK